MKFLIASWLLLSGCALLPDKDKTPQAAAKVGEPTARPQAGIEAKQLAAEQEADAFTEVQFAKGKSELAAGEAARLKKLVRKLDENADHLVIAAWADQSAPASDGKALPDKARKLADARGDVVQKFLKENGAKDVAVEFHNMAKPPTAFAKFLSTADARVKKSLEGAKPSRVVVLLKLKD